jgi:hypothetical protein
MENLRLKSANRTIFILLVILFIQSCSSLTPKKTALLKKQKKVSSRFANFDRMSFPNDSAVISNMISIVQPELESKEREAIATSMSKALAKHKIEPQIMVAIIDTESNFKNDKISTTGDLSLAQINVDVWNKELPRLGKEPIDSAKLQKDQVYAMTKMAEILKILKKRFEFKDRKWYARYHSGTRQYKTEYLNKLNIRLKMLATSPLLLRKVIEKRLAQSN